MPTPTVSVTAPTGAISTRKPTVVWVTDGFGDPQLFFWVRIFSAAQYSAGGFDPATSTPTWDTNLRNSASDTIDVSKPLPDGTFRAYVRVTTAGGTSAWAFSSFTLNDPVPSAPTSVTPANGSTVTTNRPTLGATLPATSLGARVKGEWQLATDVAFSSNLRTITEANTDLRTSGATTEATPSAQSLFQTTWYMRARTVTEYAAVSAWSATQSFTVSHPPQATAVAPKGNLWTLYGGGTVTLTWTFGDPSPDDSQTAYQVVVERSDTAATVYDSGKVSSTSNMVAVAIDAALKGVGLRWKVRLWDAGDVVGNYSPYELFTVADAPTVTSDVPTPDQVFATPLPTLEWTFSATSGRVQAYYRIEIQRVSDAAVVFETAWLPGNADSYAIADATALVNNEDYEVFFYVRDDKGLEGGTSETFSTAWTAPAEPAGLDWDSSQFDVLGYIMLTWDNTAQDGNFVAYRVYARESGTTDWVYVAETPDVDDYYMVPVWALKANTEYELAVVQVASRFTANVESTYSTVIVNTEGSHYWLLDDDAIEPTIIVDSSPPDQNDVPANTSIRMYQVTEDSYADQYEHAEFELIDRGRKEDIGTYFGHQGTLTAEIWPQENLTSQEQRLQYEALKAQRSNVMLRNPFGDLWLVALGDLDFKRTAGVGTEAMGDITIPYTEVTE